MSIVAILGAIAAVLLIVLVRMQQAANAARDITEAASDMRGMFRGWAWRRKANQNPLDLVTDPREAAACMLVAVAEYDGNMTDTEKAAIVAEMGKAFGATRKQGEELLAHARFLVRDHRDPANVFRKLGPKAKATLGAEERQQLVDMLTSIATTDGKPSDALLHDIETLRRSLFA